MPTIKIPPISNIDLSGNKPQYGEVFRRVIHRRPVHVRRNKNLVFLLPVRIRMPLCSSSPDCRTRHFLLDHRGATFWKHQSTPQEPISPGTDLSLRLRLIGHASRSARASRNAIPSAGRAQQGGVADQQCDPIPSRRTDTRTVRGDAGLPDRRKCRGSDLSPVSGPVRCSRPAQCLGSLA